MTMRPKQRVEQGLSPKGSFFATFILPAILNVLLLEKAQSRDPQAGCCPPSRATCRTVAPDFGLLPL